MHSTTRFRADPMVTLSIAAVAAGMVAGGLGGAAATLHFLAPPAVAAAPYTAPDICEMPPPSDGVGFLIELDALKRRGIAAHI